MSSCPAVNKFMIRRVIQLLIVCLVLILIYNLLVQIIDALKSQDRLSEQAEKVYKLETKNRELRNKLSQIQSPQFIEEIARNKLNLSKEGETIIVIPENTLKMIMGASASAQEIRLPNWLGWWKLFFQ